jgi:hypothetical protein
MWSLWSLPLRNLSWWSCVIGLLGTGWLCALALPWFSPLSSDSADLLLDNWAFLTRAVLGGWLVAWSVRTRGWVRTLPAPYLTAIVFVSILFLPLIVSCALARPSLAVTLHWGLASLGGLALVRSGLRPALAGWLFAALMLLSPMGEERGWHLSVWVLGLILILTGSFSRPSSLHRPTS